MRPLLFWLLCHLRCLLRPNAILLSVNNKQAKTANDQTMTTDGENVTAK